MILGSRSVYRERSVVGFARLPKPRVEFRCPATEDPMAHRNRDGSHRRYPAQFRCRERGRALEGRGALQGVDTRRLYRGGPYRVRRASMAMVILTEFVRAAEGRPRLQQRTASVTLRHHAEGSPLPRREQWARPGWSLESLTPRPGIKEQYLHDSDMHHRIGARFILPWQAELLARRVRMPNPEDRIWRELNCLHTFR